AGRDFSRRVSGSIADRRFIFFFKQKTAYEIFHVTGVQTCALPIFGIGGIAIGLAAQGIFSDLFAALSILFDKPFRVGEVITYDETTARVERIGLKSTRLRATSGERKIISNANLLQKEITSLQNLDRRQVKFAFGIAYQTPI